MSIVSVGGYHHDQQHQNCHHEDHARECATFFEYRLQYDANWGRMN
ncbi:MAG TPA: hypothetical protein VHO24_13750 [Opitutaceae bacterium]|nr:hypothetical protein [Opitutaceae bacterium]